MRRMSAPLLFACNKVRFSGVEVGANMGMS